MDIVEVSDVSEDGDSDFSASNFSNIDPHDIDHSPFTIPGPDIGVQEIEKGLSLEFSGRTAFPLLQLPPELRLLIYEPLIAAGALSIMRTNKLIHEEVAKVLKKNAVLRMNFGYAGRTSSASFPLTGSIDLTGALVIHATSLIQHVEVHFKMDAADGRSRHFDVYNNLIKSFGGRDVVRKSCTIFLDLGLFDCVPYERISTPQMVWQAITNLTGFKTLALKIRRERDFEFELLCLNQWGRLVPQTEDSYPHRSLLKDYGTIREVLEITLGPAVLDKSIQGHLLKFHPTDFEPE
ncbi:MAG: hypothetical protein ALECFALPRED_003419 [Alectoria fallacina]|uniref:F-box domain-containing protein n=1 Tax=Alectoria fallacina TaxID=1903189 RepID=A0A8H3ISV6_9LECA|nr:MAG: hypothetical protein ALECFALPRED_003419 [Alectoria fallacina]